MMSELRQLEQRLRELEAELASLNKINAALMRRVERSADSAGSAFSLFETNILLQQRVENRTKDLQNSNEQLQKEISEHKRTEHELRKSQRQTRQIIDTALDSVIAFDRNWNLLDWNPRAEKTFGYAANHALNGLTLAALIAPVGHDELSHYLSGRTCEENHAGRTLELTARHRDGHEFPVEVAVSLLHSGDMPVYGAFIRDITERKQAEETRYRTLFENSPIALREEDFSDVKHYLDKLAARRIHDLRKYFKNNPDALDHCLSLVRIYDVNLATVKLLRAESKAHVRENFSDIYRGEFAQTFIEKLISLAAGNVAYEAESALSTLDGQTIHVAISLSIAPGHTESWSKVFVSMLDISDRIRSAQEKSSLEAQVRHAQKMETIGTLAGGIAHDFNNMLSPILGYADIIADSPNDQEAVQNGVRNVVAAALRARDLVRQILTFSRQVEHELKPIRPAPLVKEALELLRASLPTTVSLQPQIDFQSNVVLADPTQIHQVILNLCTNAYQALENDAGVIAVSLQNVTYGSASEHNTARLAAGDYVCLTVADTGSGIEPSNLERIFEPFFTTKEVGSGTGMGLSVTHGIVQKHGGSITVESTRGQGTTFNVYLPAVVEGGPQVQAPETPILGGHERVLVVDDEEMVARTTQRLLERIGYAVTTFTNPQDALRKIFENPFAFDIVITDQTMPDIPGHIMAREISRIRSDLPILLLSGYSQIVTEENIQSYGIQEVLMKPIGTRELSAALRRTLDAKEITR